MRAGVLLRCQKRFAGLVAGKWGRYHADPILAEHGMLKVGDLYRQQLRVHAWSFWNGRLPSNQAAMLSRIGEVHGYGTRSARGGLHLGTRDHRSVGYRVPREWGLLTDEQRGMGSLAGFKRVSRAGFLEGYRANVCLRRDCYVCLGGGGQGGRGLVMQRGRVSWVSSSVYLLCKLCELNNETAHDGASTFLYPSINM